MKKKIFILSFAVLAIVSVITKNNSLQSKSVILNSNVEAIADPDDPDWMTYASMLNCFQQGGNWNMATTLQNSGFFEETKCKVNGELTILGVTIKGAYERGKKYSLPWASYTCTSSNGNCCLKIGLYTGDIKLA